MSAWGAGLKQSDQFMDAYDTFFDRYLRGVDPVQLANAIYAEYLEEFDPDDLTIMPDVCYALCHALWECGAWDEAMWARSERFFPMDVEFWKENAEPGFWKKRERALEKFREKVQTPKEKTRKPKTGRVYRPSLKKGDIISYFSLGVQCGAAVLEVYDRECWRALIAVARKCRKDGQKMTMDEILQSPIRCLCWFDKKDIPTRGYRELLGNLPLDTDFNGRAGASWSDEGVFSCSNQGDEMYMALSCLYLESDMRVFRKEHRLEDCTISDFFVPGAPVLPEKWI